MYPPGERTFIEEEADRALLGVLDSLVLEHSLWVSRTHSVRRADFKPLQMAVAQHLGLRVPRTLITNQPSAVRDFYHACQGNVVLKSVARGMIEQEDQQIGRFIYTSQVEAGHLVPELLEGVRVTAHLLQEYIPKKLEIRVVVIGKQVFAAEIHSQHSERARVDFRRAYDELDYAVHTLPDEIQNKVLALVRHFDLQFSSMDLLLTPEGEYVFIDLNPNGQFYWLQLRLADRLHLKEAMADLLVYPEEYRL
jgi:glutathione synthase/RimK-type ligase-like ATP-grasp enzyme